MSFLWFLVGFYGKMGEIMQIWASCRGPTLRHRDPCSGKGPCQVVACHTAAWPNGRLDKPRVRRGEDTVHNMKNVVFCSVLLFRYSKDLSIGLMRIL